MDALRGWRMGQRGSPAHGPACPGPGGSQPRLEALEPRVLLSADGLLASVAGGPLIDPPIEVAASTAPLLQAAAVTAVTPQEIPYSQIFLQGLPTAAQGWEYYSTHQGIITIWQQSLFMYDESPGDPYSLNEAILHVNLTGKSGIQLSCQHTNTFDNNHPLPASFTDHAGGDGIALSVDGIHWITVASLTGSFTGRAFPLDTALAQAQADAGSSVLSDVRIKIQQYDNYPAPDDGREFDNIRVTAGAVTAIVPQATPYIQDFSAGEPGAAQGWEYYGSTSQSRIQVTGSRLRMDDSGPGDPWSLNEAILHVNLTGKSNIQLTLDHETLADENDPLPAGFTGHANGDGIALSVDGIHWITVANLTTSFTGRTYTLDTLLDQAKLAAGSADVSNVRIKLQQYDNYPAPDDGREFDNIRLATGIAAQTLPYTQDFSAGLPGMEQGWEYYGSTSQSRIQVTGGRDNETAARIARAIANSPLVKTAIAGGDPNWGRILSAAGASGASFEPQAVDIWLQGVKVCRKGLAAQFDEEALGKKLHEREINMRFQISGEGTGKARFWTCDLTEGYIRINGSYRT